MFWWLQHKITFALHTQIEWQTWRYKMAARYEEWCEHTGSQATAVAHGSVVYRPFAFYRETCVFPPVDLKNHWKSLFGIRNYVGETYKHIKFGWDRFTGGAATQWWIVTVLWLLPSRFRFLISTTGRNSGPTCTLIGSNDVFFCTRAFLRFGLESSNSLLAVSGTANTKISTHVIDLPIEAAWSNVRAC